MTHPVAAKGAQYKNMDIAHVKTIDNVTPGDKPALYNEREYTHPRYHVPLRQSSTILGHKENLKYRRKK